MITINLSGPEGNVYNIAGIASMWNRLLETGRRNLLDEAKKRFPNGGYNDVLDLFDEWFGGFPVTKYEFVNDPRRDCVELDEWL